MTRVQLRNLILTTTNRDDKSSVADSAIDLCMTRLGQLHEWQQTRTDVTQAIVQGTSSFVLPAGTRRIIEIRFINGLLSYPMRLFPKVVALRYAPNPPALPQLRPTVCYRETASNGADTIYLIPTSDATYSIEYTVGENPSIGPDDADVANIPDVDEAIVAFGSAYVFRSIAMVQEAEIWDAQFEQCVEIAIRADKRRPGESLVMELHPGLRGRFGRQGLSMDPQHDPFTQHWT